MKPAYILTGLGALSLIECVFAYPGMGNTVHQIKQRMIEKRQGEDDDGDGDTEGELIGDIKDGGTTPVGKTVARILLEQETGQSSESGYTLPGRLESAKCKADTCCVWAYVSQRLSSLFMGPSGRCNKHARAAVRLGFHDAGTWSKSLAQGGQDFGGADGSIVLSGTEITRPENNGLNEIANTMTKLQAQFGVGMADLIQFAAKHAVVSKSSYTSMSRSLSLTENSMSPWASHSYLRRQEG